MRHYFQEGHSFLFFPFFCFPVCGFYGFCGPCGCCGFGFPGFCELSLLVGFCYFWLLCFFYFLALFCNHCAGKASLTSIAVEQVFAPKCSKKQGKVPQTEKQNKNNKIQRESAPLFPRALRGCCHEAFLEFMGHGFDSHCQCLHLHNVRKGGAVVTETNQT